MSFAKVVLNLMKVQSCAVVKFYVKFFFDIYKIFELASHACVQLQMLIQEWQWSLTLGSISDTSTTIVVSDPFVVHFCWQIDGRTDPLLSGKTSLCKRNSECTVDSLLCTFIHIQHAKFLYSIYNLIEIVFGFMGRTFAEKLSSCVRNLESYLFRSLQNRTAYVCKFLKRSILPNERAKSANLPPRVRPD